MITGKNTSEPLARTSRVEADLPLARGSRGAGSSHSNRAADSPRPSASRPIERSRPPRLSPDRSIAAALAIAIIGALALSIVVAQAPAHALAQGTPPTVELTVGDVVQRGALGSHCWDGVCRDVAGFRVARTALRALPAASAMLEIDLSIPPTRVDIRAYRADGPAPEIVEVEPGTWVPMGEGTVIPAVAARTQSIALPDVQALYVLHMLAAWEGGLTGDAFYGFLVDIQVDVHLAYLPIALKGAPLVHSAPTAIPPGPTPTITDPGTAITPPPSSTPTRPTGTDEPTATPTPAGGTDEPGTPTPTPSDGTPEPGTPTPTPAEHTPEPDTPTPSPTSTPTGIPLPTPFLGDGPWTEFEIGGVAHRARLGTHCWTRGCVDYIGIITQVEPVRASPQVSATLRIGPVPTSLDVDIYPVVAGPDGGDEVGSGDDWRAWAPRATPISVKVIAAGEQMIELPAEEGLYVMAAFTGWDGSGPGGHRGDALFGLLLEVRE